MGKAFRVPLLAATAVVCLALSATAQAAPLTIGSPLAGDPDPTTAGANATFANITVEGPGARATSPVDGAIVRWHLLGAEGGPIALRVLRPAGSFSFTGTGTSSPIVAAGPGLQTFATALPIQAGDTIGLDVAKGGKVGFILPAPLSSFAAWAPALPEGATRPYPESTAGAELAFNAEVQPQPTVTALSPSSGPITGGSAVTIGGTDFAGVSAVGFGATPATSFAVGSEGQITAVAPPGAAGPTDVTVITVAGTSPAVGGDEFTYTAPASPSAPTSTAPTPTCTVPKLGGKKLKAAKNSLRKADCKLGNVKKLIGATARTGRVKKQSPKPGKVLAAGSKVGVWLSGKGLRR